MARMKPIARAFFARLPHEVAPQLLGKLLVHADGRIARLVEVESYAQDDPAAHSFIGQTPRNRSMFGPPGHWYVYQSHGIHWGSNVVCGAPGHGAGVLLRAAEPLAGLEAMRAARGLDDVRLLCAGPGRLSQAFGIDRRLDGSDLLAGDPISLRDDGFVPERIVAAPRIGISKNAHAPLRFVVAGSRYLSRPLPKALR